MWYLYIVKCKDNTFYTGICKDLEKRILEHNDSPLGAKYTKARRPVRLIYSRAFDTRSDATKEECRIKKLSRDDKKKLMAK